MRQRPAPPGPAPGPRPRRTGPHVDSRPGSPLPRSRTAEPIFSQIDRLRKSVRKMRTPMRHEEADPGEALLALVLVAAHGASPARAGGAADRVRIERRVVGGTSSPGRPPTRARRGAGAATARILAARDDLQLEAALRPAPGGGIMGRWRDSTRRPRRGRPRRARRPGARSRRSPWPRSSSSGGDAGRAAWLAPLLRAVALGTGAELVVARLADGEGRLVAAGCRRRARRRSPRSSQGTHARRRSRSPSARSSWRTRPATLPRPAAVRRVAARAGLPIVRLVPVVARRRRRRPARALPLGTPLRPGGGGARARRGGARRSGASRLERGGRRRGRTGTASCRATQLELLGEALAAGADEEEAAEQIVRLAAEAAGAAGATLWRLEADGAPSLLAAHGFGAAAPDLVEAAESVPARAGERRPERDSLGLVALVHTLPLGEPPVAALRLSFDAGRRAASPTSSGSSPFGARRGARAAPQPHGPAEVEVALRALADARRRRRARRSRSSRSRTRSRRRSSGSPSWRRAGTSPSTSATRAGSTAAGLARPRGTAHRARRAAARARARAVPQPRLPLRRGPARRPAPRRARGTSSRRAASAARSSSRCSSATR